MAKDEIRLMAWVSFGALLLIIGALHQACDTSKCGTTAKRRSQSHKIFVEFVETKR